MERLSPLKNIDPQEPEKDVPHRAVDIARIITIAAQHGLYKATCLRRSMLVWWFLRKENIPSEICFGVRKVNEKMEAHAWVEYKDNVINDSANVHKSFHILRDVFPPTNSGL